MTAPPAWVIPAGAAPEILEIRLDKLDLDSITGQPPADGADTVLAVEINTFKVGDDVPTPTTYLQGVELWLLIPEGEESSCAEERVEVYRVEPNQWALVEHRCEVDNEGYVWAVSTLTYFSVYTLVIESAPAPATPTPEPTVPPAPPQEDDDEGIPAWLTALLLLAPIAAALTLAAGIWLLATRRRKKDEQAENAPEPDDNSDNTPNSNDTPDADETKTPPAADTAASPTDADAPDEPPPNPNTPTDRQP